MHTIKQTNIKNALHVTSLSLLKEAQAHCQTNKHKKNALHVLMYLHHQELETSK
jgi:hypothetical protein